MDLPSPTDLTELLAAAQRGDPDAADAFARAVYDELRALASGYLRRERADHTLQPTALVNEAYLRLFGHGPIAWQNRGHFFAVAAQVMRRLLVDHARRAGAGKRAGGRAIALERAEPPLATDDAELLLGVHEALDGLAALDPRQARIVELRYFVGLTIDETAEVLGLSPATISREWTLARAWLHQELRGG